MTDVKPVELPTDLPPVDQAPLVPTSRREKRRVIVGAGVGNALEWYDWTAYSVFAAYFAGQFFNPQDPLAALLGTLAVFGAGFFMRPLGGLLFGWMADRHGRRKAMTTAMTITAGGSFLIGISPTYETIGAAAALLLLGGRLLQGVGHGGEVVSSYTYVTEMASPNRRGLWASSVFVFVTFGVTVATLLGAVLTSTLGAETVSEWGWRVPFILGGVLGIYALWLRRNLNETPMFKAKNADDRKVQVPNMWREMWKYRAAMLRIAALAGGGTLLYYVWVIMAPTFAMGALGMNPEHVMWVSTAGNVLLMAALVFWGWFSDRFGRKINWYIFAFGGMLMVIPMTLILTGGDGEMWRLVFYLGFGVVLIAAPTAIMPAYLPEQFPTHIRAVGMGFPYSLAGAITGGTAPYLQTWLYSEGLPRVFDYYLIGILALVVVAVIYSPETKGEQLHKN